MEVRSVSDLPFVKCDNGQVVSMWSVKRGTDFVMDNRRGRCYADRLVQYMRESGNPTLLLRVLQDINLADLGGIEVGFITQIASTLIRI